MSAAVTWPNPRPRLLSRTPALNAACPSVSNPSEKRQPVLFRSPELERGFRVPAAPVVAILGIITCGAMIYGLGWTNWMRLIGWLLVGFIFYFAYGKSHSRINVPPPEIPEGIKLSR